MTNKKGGRPPKATLDKRSVIVRLSITPAEHQELLKVGESLRINSLSSIGRAVIFKKVVALGASRLNVADVQSSLIVLNRLAGLLTDAVIVYKNLYLNGCFTDLHVDEEQKDNAIAYAKKLHEQLARVEALLLGRELNNEQ
ncbi:hypothetical protein ACLKQF_09645 [Aeromonas salmonicida]